MWNLLLNLLLYIMMFSAFDDGLGFRGCLMMHRGHASQKGRFPWMVALHRKWRNEFICSASLIADNLVLSAAHCITLSSSTRPEDYYGIADVNRSSFEIRIEFDDLILHPDYKQDGYDGDIAILRTKNSIALHPTIHPICIAGGNTKSKRYHRVLAMGWGATNASTSLQPEVLQYAALKVIGNSMCSIPQSTVTSSTLCTVGIRKGICNGDSGGPVIVYSRRGVPVQIGVASYANAQLGCGKLSMYMRISYYYDFIKQAAQNSTLCIIDS